MNAIVLNDAATEVLRVLYTEKPPVRPIESMALDKAIEELAALGLVGYGDRGSLALTPRGLTYCERAFGPGAA